MFLEIITEDEPQNFILATIIGQVKIEGKTVSVWSVKNELLLSADNASNIFAIIDFLRLATEVQKE